MQRAEYNDTLPDVSNLIIEVNFDYDTRPHVPPDRLITPAPERKTVSHMNRIVSWTAKEDGTRAGGTGKEKGRSSTASHTRARTRSRVLIVAHHAPYILLVFCTFIYLFNTSCLNVKSARKGP